MLNITQIWNNILIEAEPKTSTIVYDIFIHTLKPLGIHKDRLILLAQTPHLKNLVVNNYKDVLIKSTEKVFPSITDVEIICEEDVKILGDVETEVDIPVSGSFIEDTEEEVSFREEYTFENFVVGKCNEYACAVCEAVSENPGKKYNPVFIWGGVGLGKTHLMHAIGNRVKRLFPEKKVMYVTSEKFTNELIETVRFRSKDPEAAKNFRKKYRNVDVLMIDDIQMLAGREGTQEEFFNTFNDLYNADKQIVICSDRPPKEINISERLKTRFSTGIIADVQQPDLETRIAILQKKCINKKEHINLDVLTLIAQKVTSNIRDMEGILSRIISYSSLVGGDCNDMNMVNEALRDYATVDNKEEITIDHVVDATCEYFGVERADLLGKKKNKEIVLPRQICMYIISEMLSTPLMAIGKYFGGKDHSTVGHARDKIAEDIKVNKTIAMQVKDIKDRICNR